MTGLSFFIAKRIYKSGGYGKKVSRPAIRIATAGVAIGLAVMIVSVSIVFGFKHTIRDKAVGFGCHINVANFMSLHGREARPVCMTDSMMKVLKSTAGVKHVQRYTTKQGILKTDDDFLGVAFKGIAQEYDTTFIHTNLISGSIPAFSDSASSGKLLISKVMADKLKLNSGDRVFAYFVDNGDVRVRRFTIEGIYQTNLAQFDNSLCYTDLYTTTRLNGWEQGQASGAEITVNGFNKINTVEDLLVNKVNRTIDRYGETYSSETIIDAYPQIFTWLDLLDLNVWIILALMLCVAGFTMISGLLIIILERTGMIGILKALGSGNKAIARVFLWFGAFVIGRGLLLGNIIGIGLVVLQKYTGLVKLDAATYYVSTVPVEFNIPIILLINIGTLLISLLVLIAPSCLVATVHPAKSMRYE